jgi:hypothetical protein
VISLSPWKVKKSARKLWIDSVFSYHILSKLNSTEIKTMLVEEVVIKEITTIIMVEGPMVNFLSKNWATISRLNLRITCLLK